MKIEIEMPVAALKSALPGFSKIIPKKVTLPILGCVKVSLNEQTNVIQIEATNLDETVQYRLPNPANGISGEVLVPLGELTKIVKACSSKDSIRIIGEQKRTIIRYPLGGGFIDQAVDKEDLKEWPVMPTVDGNAIALTDSFKSTLQQALECASSDTSRPNIAGACLDVSNPKGHYVVGTDGRHLFSANTFNFDLKSSLLIPSKKFVGWTGFTEDGAWHLQATFPENGNGWFRIESDHWSYISRQNGGNYPNWKQVVPTLNSDWTKLIVSDTAAESIMGAIPMLPGGNEPNEPIDILVARKGLTIRGRERNGRKSDVPIDGIQVVGNPVETSINRSYFLKALRFGFRDINILDPVSPILFINGGKTMVVMPLRGDAAEKWYAAHPPQNSPPVGATAEAPKGEASAPPEGAGSPSPAEQQTNETTEERTSMDGKTMQPPQRGNLTGTETKSDATGIEEVLGQIEKVRDDLRDVFNDLNECERMLKKAAKEQKVTEKEINRVRASLRTLQSVDI